MVLIFVYLLALIKLGSPQRSCLFDFASSLNDALVSNFLRVANTLVPMTLKWESNFVFLVCCFNGNLCWVNANITRVYRHDGPLVSPIKFAMLSRIVGTKIRVVELGSVFLLDKIEFVLV